MPDTVSLGHATAPAADPARIYATIGMHGSASTWVFNVVRELAIVHHGADAVHSLFANGVTDIGSDTLPAGRIVVWKLHHADAGWDAICSRVATQAIVTIRDPRDCVVSMMQRFGMTFPDAADMVLRSCVQVTQATRAGHPGLRYETRFHANPNTTKLIARRLELDVPDVEHARIFAAYTTERVREFSAGVDGLSPERQRSISTMTLYDHVTQIHRTHIGDGRSGKWRDMLDTDQQGALAATFGPFLVAFGYDR